MIITLLLVLMVLAFFVLRTQKTRRAKLAERLDRAQPTEKQIRSNLRRDVPAPRPYGPGDFGTDADGKIQYMAGIDGALRRVRVVRSPEGGYAVLKHTKLSKNERRRRKAEATIAQRRLDRERDREVTDFSAHIERQFALIRSGLVIDGADPEKTSQINVDAQDWHDIGRRIVAAARTTKSWKAPDRFRLSDLIPRRRVTIRFQKAA